LLRNRIKSDRRSSPHIRHPMKCLHSLFYISKMSSGIHRKRLACVECTRRKVKCDKILPCRNCSRKGTPCTRPRERASLNPSVAQSEGHIERNVLIRSSVDASRIIERLQSRADQLEAALKEANEAASSPSMPRPEGQLNSNSFSAGKSVPIDTSPRSLHTSTPTVHTVHTAQTNSENTPNEEDAATILEFLAWGRRKDPTYHNEVARRNNLDHSPGDIPAEDEWGDICTQGISAGSFCQALLPTKQKVYQLANYHCKCLL
jgi:hypothetical protein